LIAIYITEIILSLRKPGSSWYCGSSLLLNKAN